MVNRRRSQTATDLEDIAERAEHQKLTPADIKALRRLIKRLQKNKQDSPLARTTRRNLKIADTQLREMQERMEDEPLDDETFSELPPYLRKQILTRLDNNAKRLQAALEAQADNGSQARKNDYQAPSFKCIEDFEKCRKKPPGSVIWCHIAMIICQINALQPLAAAVSGSSKK